jgi:rubrerythrin
MGLLSRLFGTGATRNLLVDLAEDYAAEMTQAAMLRAHAERAKYPQAAEALRRLAEIEERHANWLRDRVRGLGGTVPAFEPPSRMEGSSQWQRAVTALHTAQAKRRRLIEQIAHWDPEEPEVVELLRRIEQEDVREHAVYEGLVMRSDPHSFD